MYRKSSLMSLALLSCCMAAAGDDGSAGGGGAGGAGGAASTTQPPAAPKPAKAAATKGRVLTDCAFGKCNDVVALSGNDLEQAIASGHFDISPGAVKYALTLEQNKPKVAPDAVIE